MEKTFRHMLSSAAIDEKQTFESELFTSTLGYFPAQQSANLHSDTTEKKQVADAIKEYVISKPHKKIIVADHEVSYVDDHELLPIQIVDSYSKDDFINQEKELCSNKYFDDEFKGERPLVMFVADCPREPQEDEYVYRSFNGESARLIEKMIKAMKIGDNFITVLLSYSTLRPGDINYQKALIEQFPYPVVKAMLLKPKLIVTLGATATNLFLGRKEKLSTVHGQFNQRLLKAHSQEVPVTFSPLFHPEYLLINGNMKKTAWKDMQKMMKFIGIV